MIKISRPEVLVAKRRKKEILQIFLGSLGLTALALAFYARYGILAAEEEISPNIMTTLIYFNAVVFMLRNSGLIGILIFIIDLAQSKPEKRLKQVRTNMLGIVGFASCIWAIVLAVQVVRALPW